jgi:hypothetical protein
MPPQAHSDRHYVSHKHVTPSGMLLLHHITNFRPVTLLKCFIHLMQVLGKE